jgi:hypothetical protein
MESVTIQPHILRGIPGRALFIARDGRCYISRKYEIFASDDWGATWRLDCRVPPVGWKPWVAAVKPLARLLRYNIQAFQVLEDGTRLAVARDGIYRAEAGEITLRRVFKVTRGSRPLNLCADGSRLLFGEYGDGFGNSEIFLYVSEDRGKTWEVGYSFPPFNIRHVHNILVDPLENHYWVFVGDYGQETGIGVLSKDLQHIEWLIRGCREARAVGAIIHPDCLLYGTDLDLGENHLIRLEKRSGKLTKLMRLEGSSLYATSYGPCHAISTSVEPNPTCPTKECSLYISRDGDRWNRVFTHRKDFLSPLFFQMGCLVLPYSNYDKPRGMFSGQAVVGAHDRTTLLDFE